MEIEETKELIDWLKENEFSMKEAAAVTLMLETTNASLAQAICQAYETKQDVLSTADILQVLDRLKEVIRDAAKEEEDDKWK